ncbi:MAG: response regulator transcription factor [Betaproteobacteria bacterium]|nr:response regulator transcription factor [Betaproteobacteria bacterium]
MTLPALRVVIADDESPARYRLKDLLEDCSESVPAQVVGEVASGDELIELLETVHADLVLLDIRMPGMDGIEAAQHLLAMEKPPAVIFTTAFDVYAVKAFEMHAVDYLLKPIRLQRLHDALKRIKRETPLTPSTLEALAADARSHIPVTERGKVTLVPVNKILYMRADQKYVSLKTHEHEYLLEDSLSRLEQEFCDSFVRIHRSCLVSRAHIAGFERGGDDGEGQWQVELRGTTERLPVSRRQQHVIKQLAS